MRAGTRCAGRKPCSALKRRTSVMTACSEATNASPATSYVRTSSSALPARTPAPSTVTNPEGQVARTNVSPPVRVVHNSSDTKGIKGCQSRSSTSSTCPSTRRVAAASAPPRSRGSFASSTYQSQNSSQVKWKSASHAFANWKSSKYRSTSAAVRASLDRIHRSVAGSVSRSGAGPSTLAPLMMANLVAFQSLVTKLRPPCANSSLTGMSDPGDALRARVNRAASAP